MTSSDIDRAKVYAIAGGPLQDLVRTQEKVQAMQGRGGISVTVSDKNIIVSIGSSVTAPDGTVVVPQWIPVTMCDGETEVTIYVWGYQAP